MRLTIEEYESWIPGELEKVLRPTRSKAAKLVEEARRALAEGEGFFEDLSRKADKDMATKRDVASYRAARVIGHSARIAAESLKEVQAPKDINWESLKNLKDGLSAASRSIRAIRNRASKELSGFYILDMRSFSGVLDRVSKNGERVSAFLDGEGSNLQKARTMAGIVESILGARRELLEKLGESEKMSRECEEVETSIGELTVKLDRLAPDDLLGEVLKIERELRMESLAFRTETLAHLQRPLRRLRDLSQRGDFAIGSEERDALFAYIQSPYKSFLSNTKGAYLNTILENVKKAIGSGKMEFRPRKTSRISAQLKELITTDHLREKQRKGRELLARRRELLQDPNRRSMYQTRKEVLSRIQEARGLEVSISERSRSVRETSEALIKRLIELLSQAEGKTREYVGQDVQLERPTVRVPRPTQPM